MGNAKPVGLTLDHGSPGKRKIIEEQIDMMLEDGINEPASAPWTSLVVIVERQELSHDFFFCGFQESKQVHSEGLLPTTESE